MDKIKMVKMTKDLEGRRRFLKLAGTGSLAVLVGTTFGIGGCKGNFSEDDNKNIAKYLKQEYLNADIAQPDYAYPQNIEEYTKLVNEHMPYVNITNPTQRDRVFLSNINDKCGLEDVLSYMEIDMKNLTEEQKRELKEANAYNMVEGDEKEHRKFLEDFPWIDYDNMTDKDKIWLRKVGRGTMEWLPTVHM